MKQSLDGLQIDSLGLIPSTFVKLGKLIRIDYEGAIRGIMLFDGKSRKEAILEVVKEIEKDFTVGKKIELLQEKTRYPVRIYPNIKSDDGISQTEWEYVVKINKWNLLNKSERENGYIQVFSDKELCNALFKAIVEILNYIPVSSKDLK